MNPVKSALFMAVAAGETSTASTGAVAPAKKGRGLSFEEKRKRLSEYLLEKVNGDILEKFI